MGAFKETFACLGRSLAAAGRFVGRATADYYRVLDPDVPRHVAVLPLLSFTLLSSRKVKIERREPDGCPPLIFVHGLGATRGSFLLMELYFRLLGRKRSYRIDFKGCCSMNEMAERLARCVEEVLAVNGARQVELVAHSMGGLVARLAIADHRLDKQVKTLVTLGTPHQGTYPARYANTCMTREMRPDSPLLARLNSTPLPEGLRFVAFWSPNDLIVLPNEAATLPGAEAVEMPGLTHYSYLIDRRCWSAVYHLLSRPLALPLPTPAPKVAPLA